ncbi:NAD-dependent epimerase/dehydratase family protein [Actinomadura sp. BRA 177]|nr:NAD-dependent epimerase/dehydratase family protein [Actinomadura sp. BRA 177]NVI87907.1 hypothetical protein [Actinomadura sp. BRA 177]
MILVTGASGTLGRPVARLLAEGGDDVHSLSRVQARWGCQIGRTLYLS